MKNHYVTRTSSSAGRQWLWLLAILAMALTGCGTSDPETTTQPSTTDTQRSANFVSAQPPVQVTTPQWQQPQPRANDFNQLPRYRSDPGASTGNPWARPLPGNMPPAAATPGYQQPYPQTSRDQTYSGSQPPTYRYRPLNEKEKQQMQRQQQWTAENQYPSSQPYNPYGSPPPVQPPATVNPWENTNRWGRYPPTRDR